MAGTRDTYDAMAADYAAHVETSPYTALYEAPGLRALLPPLTGHQVLDAGCGTGRTSARLAAAGAEVVGFDVSPEMLRRDRWSVGEREYDVRFWRRPLSEMFRAFAAGGFRVDQLSEPQPLAECRHRFPAAWERLTQRPQFLFLRLTPV